MRNLFLIFLLLLVLTTAACSDGAADSALPTRAAAVDSPTIPATAPPPAIVAGGTELPPTATTEPGPTATPEPTHTPTPLPPQIINPLDDGRIEYIYPGEMFAVTLPPSWSVADLSGFQGGESAAETAAGGELEELFSSGLFRDLIDSGIRFYAINSSDLSLNSSNPASINIVSIPAAAGTLTALVEENLTQIAENFELVADVVQTEVEIDGRPAARLEYTAVVTNPLGESFELTTWQFVVEGENRFLVLTGTVMANQALSFGPDVEAAAASLRIVTP